MGVDDELRAAAHDISHPVRATREAAERRLIAARAASVPFLVEALTTPVPQGSPSPIARAALLLGAMGAREALPALYDLLDGGRLAADERPVVARSLAEMLDGRDAFDDRSRSSLEKLADDPDHSVRAFAARAFGRLGDLRSRARVAALAEDKHGFVRDAASEVLARLAEQDARATSDVGPADFAALVAAAEAEGGALKPWLDDLGDARRPVRDAATVELVKAGRAAVPYLVDKLNQPFARARIGAAMALGRIGASEAAGPLVVAATSPATTPEDKELRAVALRSLANCLTGMEEGLAASLLPLARDPDRFTKAGALLCLGRLGDRAGMKAVVEAIAERDPFVVESAAIALSEGVRDEDTALVSALLAAFAQRPTPAPAVQEAILIALSRITIEDEPWRVRVRHRVRPLVHGPTAATRKAAIVLLEGLYGDHDPPPVTLQDDALIRLGDDHPEVRVVAAAFLGKHLEPGLTGAALRLVESLSRRERTVSLLALEALRRHDTPEAKEALAAAAHESDEVVATRSAELLQGFEPMHREWTAESKLPAEPRPGRTETQRPSQPPEKAPEAASATAPPRPAEPPRPSRVRTVSPTAARTAPPSGAVVEAKFDDDPQATDDEKSAGSA